MARSDFNGFQAPHYQILRLMEQVVAPLRPAQEAIAARATELEESGINPGPALKKARSQLDVAEVLRKRSFDELKKRTGLSEVSR